MHGRGIDGCGHVLKAQRKHARLQVNLADVADEREIRVVNGDGKIGLVLFRGRPSFGFGLVLAVGCPAARTAFNFPASGKSKRIAARAAVPEICTLRDDMGCLLRMNVAA